MTIGKGLKVFSKAINKAEIALHFAGNSYLNAGKRASLRFLSKPFSRTHVGFTGQRLLLQSKGNTVKYFKQLYKYPHNIMTTKTFNNLKEVRQLYKYGKGIIQNGL